MKQAIRIPLPLFFAFLLAPVWMLHAGNAAAQKRDSAANRLRAVPEARKPRDRWAPPDIDLAVPRVSPTATCDLPTVLAHAGKRVEELVDNLNRFSATEVVWDQKVDRSGHLRRAEILQFDYIASVTRTRSGDVNFDEYRNGKESAAEFSDHVATFGTPSLVLIFHPRYAKNFRMECEGMSQWQGRPAWQVHFEERLDQSNRMATLEIDGRAYGMSLRGRAWILADSYQVARVETDLLQTIPQVRLRLEHEDIQYRPVHFSWRNLTLWLPASVELYMDFRGHRFYRRHSFTQYKVFAVDVQEKFDPVQ